MINELMLNEDGFYKYVVCLDFVQCGKVFIEVYATSPDEAWHEAIEIMTSLKSNDCSVESVSQKFNIKSIN